MERRREEKFGKKERRKIWTEREGERHLTCVVEMSYLAIMKCVETCGPLAPTRAYQPLADVEVPRTPASFTVSWAFGTVRLVDYSHISVAVHCLLIDWLFVFFHFVKLTLPVQSLLCCFLRASLLLLLFLFIRNPSPCVPVVLLIACLPAYKYVAGHTSCVS
jgi:hypothetical protein